MKEQPTQPIAINLSTQPIVKPEGGFDPWQRYVNPHKVDIPTIAHRFLMGAVSGMVISTFLLSAQAAFYPVEAPLETEIKSEIAKLAEEYPTYGYRRITAMLHRGGQRVNNKRVRRLMAEMGLVGKCPQKRCRTTNSQHGFPRYPNRVAGLVVERPDQLWVGDITYVKLGNGFVYLAVLMDVFTRSIRGWQLARSMEVELTLVALKRALARGSPEMHHSDQGVQYAAKAYTTLLEEQGAEISMAEVGEPTQNGYAERLMRTIKEEEVELSEYRNFEEAYQEIGKFLDDVYTKKRIHSSLGYLTPIEFENQWKEEGKKKEKTTEALT